MATGPTQAPLDFLRFIPSSGDGANLGTEEPSRPPDPDSFREIAKAADRLGYSGVLIPGAAACGEACATAADLAAHTERAHLDGRHVKSRHATLGSPPVQQPRPPLDFGGSSEAVIAL